MAFNYLIHSTHASNGANVVGDGDQGGSGKVLFTDGVSFLFAHHVAKAVEEEKKKSRKRLRYVEYYMASYMCATNQDLVKMKWGTGYTPLTWMLPLTLANQSAHSLLRRCLSLAYPH